MNDTRLTESQCDEFRRLPGSFNDMVRAIYAAGRASMAKVPELTDVSIEKLLRSRGEWCEPFTAERESGVAIEQDISQGDADEINQRGIDEERQRFNYLLSLSALPKGDRTDLAQRAVEARGIPDDVTLNQSAAALAGDGKSEGTIPKDDTQADSDPGKTHYADDDTIKYIATLEAENAALQERLAGYEDAPVVAWRGTDAINPKGWVTSRDPADIPQEFREPAVTYAPLIVKPVKEGTKP